MSSIRSVNFGGKVCIQSIDHFPVIFHISRVRQGKKIILNIGPVRWSSNARLLCLLFAFSSFRIKPLLSANSSNVVRHCFHRKPSVFWSPWQSNVLIWFRSLSSMFLTNFLFRWLLGVLFYPRHQCCDQSSWQITKDYNEFNLERWLYSAYTTRGP